MMQKSSYLLHIKSATRFIDTLHRLWTVVSAPLTGIKEEERVGPTQNRHNRLSVYLFHNECVIPMMQVVFDAS